MRVLEVSLRKAGFTVTTATSIRDALDKLELNTPDLIISETTFPDDDGDGFELPRRVRAMPERADIPFIFLTAEASIQNKIKGLELGVDDYLTKPIYIKEIITRINILLQKRQRSRFEDRRDGHTRFAGRVADMPVVDVIQTIEISRKSGVIQFVGERGRQATIYFRDGRVIDAEAGSLQGEDAIYRLLTWNDGEFEVVFRTVRRREVITTSSQAMLMEGMRRLDEWSRLLEQLPPLTHRFEVDAAELAVRLGDVPDDHNRLLRLIDGKRTLLEVIDASDVGDLECLQAIARLYFEELLVDLDHGKSERRDTGKPMPLVEVDVPSPIEAAASGPIQIDAIASRASAPEIQDADVLSEQAVEAREDAAPGALLGGYRPSSLRLIDEAVAAAQAIEPSLFDDEPAPSKPDTTLGSPPAAVSDHAFAREEATVAAASSAANGIAIARTATPITELTDSDVEEERSAPTDAQRDAARARHDPAAPDHARVREAPGRDDLVGPAEAAARAFEEGELAAATTHARRERREGARPGRGSRAPDAGLAPRRAAGHRADRSRDVRREWRLAPGERARRGADRAVRARRGARGRRGVRVASQGEQQEAAERCRAARCGTHERGAPRAPRRRAARREPRRRGRARRRPARGRRRCAHRAAARCRGGREPRWR